MREPQALGSSKGRKTKHLFLSCYEGIEWLYLNLIGPNSVVTTLEGKNENMFNYQEALRVSLQQISFPKSEDCFSFFAQKYISTRE